MTPGWYEAAINVCNDVLAMDDQYQLPRYYLATALALTQNYEQRAHAVARSASSESYVQQNLAVDGFTFGLEGDTKSAAAKLAELQNMSRSRYVSPFNMAQVLVGMRQYEAAIDEFNAALRSATRGKCFWPHIPLSIRFEARRDSIAWPAQR